MDTITNEKLSGYLFELAKGNIKVLEHIYSSNAKILYSIGNSFFKNRIDVESSISDLLIKLVDVASEFKGGNARAWIVKIYKNLLINKTKRMKLEEKYMENFQPFRPQNDEAFIENFVFLNEIFQKLNFYEQDLVVYKYWCGCTLTELATIMKKPKSTLQSQLEKLEKKIREMK